ncbi:PepSY-associated TM helix domain-containing protein [Dongia sedimenti]|uniref:PepSY-associated TM helix domain-containing protein n=1 Tax=Dongia sedimenti TaxID=3064282 RepID=A0ABU0YJ95_9PROT|nr:PepSY-associated TM helix domain-containing protein [Rhodospirillaceae bacterium R-7]
MLRPILVLIHRFVGLAIAAFLFISGVTGAVISWDHELDELINPHLVEAPGRGAFLDPLVLADRIAVDDPHSFITYVPLHPEEGHNLAFGAEPRFDARTGALYETGYNQIFVDPVTGETRGKREWGAAWPISTETFVSFLYVLHYSLHIPEMWGIDRWGEWLMGGVALLWTIDCFVGFYLTLPIRKRTTARIGTWWNRWKPAWKIKARGSAYRLNFDLHRAFSLWTWLLLFVLAVSAVSLNLYAEVARPIVTALSSFTPTPYDTRPMRPHSDLLEPRVTYAQVLANGRAEAQRRGFTLPAGDIFYSPDFGVFGVRFFNPGDEHGDGIGLGNAVLYFDSEDGRYIGDWIPWRGTAGDLFLQMQFPVHSGRIFGIPGRIIISAMGLVVAMLSVTGVVIWLRKRRARLAVRRPAEAAHQRNIVSAE